MFYIVEIIIYVNRIFFLYCPVVNLRKLICILVWMHSCSGWAIHIWFCWSRLTICWPFCSFQSSALNYQLFVLYHFSHWNFVGSAGQSNPHSCFGCCRFCVVVLTFCRSSFSQALLSYLWHAGSHKISLFQPCSHITSVQHLMLPTDIVWDSHVMMEDAILHYCNRVLKS